MIDKIENTKKEESKTSKISWLILLLINLSQVKK